MHTGGYGTIYLLLLTTPRGYVKIRQLGRRGPAGTDEKSIRDTCLPMPAIFHICLVMRHVVMTYILNNIVKFFLSITYSLLQPVGRSCDHINDHEYY